LKWRGASAVGSVNLRELAPGFVAAVSAAAKVPELEALSRSVMDTLKKWTAGPPAAAAGNRGHIPTVGEQREFG
jgi:hypothetical protein